MEAIVVDSKLIFRVQEIPDEKSERKLHLNEDDLDLESIKMNGADVEIEFYKTIHFIKVDFSVIANVVLTCDRSLEVFDFESSGKYSVIFEPSPETTSEDESLRIKAIDNHDMAISIEDEVRDTIMLGLPARNLHPKYFNEQGQPLDFETQTFGNQESDENVIDPRWEKLKKLKN